MTPPLPRQTRGGHGARVEAVARAFYRRWMAEDYDEFPWDDDNLPSNETEREAREFAEIAVGALDAYDAGSMPDGVSPERLRVALAECLGSYESLVANLAGLAKSAPSWDGPTLARGVLGRPNR